MDRAEVGQEVAGEEAVAKAVALQGRLVGKVLAKRGVVEPPADTAVDAAAADVVEEAHRQVAQQDTQQVGDEVYRAVLLKKDYRTAVVVAHTNCSVCMPDMELADAHRSDSGSHNPPHFRHCMGNPCPCLGSSVLRLLRHLPSN
jgi:hypothetical protein